MLQNQSLKFFDYMKFDADVDLKNNPFMILDSTAIENLEVVECLVNGMNTIDGSLLQWVDHTQTMFGKRQIRKWLLSPLICPYKINDRLDAVEDLTKIPVHLNTFRERMSKLMDLEKILAKVFVYSVKSTFRAVTVENVSFAKLIQHLYLIWVVRVILASHIVTLHTRTVSVVVQEHVVMGGKQSPTLKASNEVA